MVETQRDEEAFLKHAHLCRSEVTPGLNARRTTDTRRFPMALGIPFHAMRNHLPSVRSERRRKLNLRLMVYLLLTNFCLLLVGTIGTISANHYAAARAKGSSRCHQSSCRGSCPPRPTVSRH